MVKILFWYFIIVNLCGVYVMYSDKEKAKQGRWRTPEATLWRIALLGGAVGSYIGMKMFRHKTQHLQFKYGFPLLAMLELGIIGYFFL